MRPRAHPPPAIEAVASVAERLAVLLSAGVPPLAAWEHLAADPNAQADSAGTPRRDAARRPVSGGAGRRAPERVARDIVARIAARAEVADLAAAIAAAADAPASGRMLRGQRLGAATRPEGSDAAAWGVLAVTWFAANEAGAPLAATLREVAASFRAIGESERDIRVALAGPRATARMVVALPFVGVLFGLAMGFDIIGVLFASAPGLGCLAVGSLLLFAGARWNRALVMRATSRETAPGLELDLVAVAMAGGVSVDRARGVAAEAIRRFAIETSDGGAVERVLALAVRAGVPAGELLRSEAALLRREARSAAQQRSAELGVTLMLPLGCCVLPSFLLLGVAPVLIALVSSTIGSLA